MCYVTLANYSSFVHTHTHTHAPLQLVDHPLTHPQDLEDIDQTLYHTLTTLQDEIIDGWFVFIPKINYRVFFYIRRYGAVVHDDSPVPVDQSDGRRASQGGWAEHRRNQGQHSEWVLGEEVL